MSAANFDDIFFSAMLVPHRSLGRRGLLVLMGVIAALLLVGSAYFWWLGAWPVLGFFGLDLLAIAIAFRLNHRAARAYEEIEVSQAALVIRKVAANGRAEELRFNPRWVRLELERHKDDEVQRIAVRAREQRVPVGAFLNPDDRQDFARAFGDALAAARRGFVPA